MPVNKTAFFRRYFAPHHAIIVFPSIGLAVLCGELAFAGATLYCQLILGFETLS